MRAANEVMRIGGEAFQPENSRLGVSAFFTPLHPGLDAASPRPALAKTGCVYEYCVGCVSSWDARNRLVGISGPGVAASFMYDAFGRRVSKTINGVKTEYLYSGDDIVAEIQGGAVTVTYLRGLNIDEPFIRQTSSGNEYYHTDALGSVLALTDATGAVRTTYAYDPFGNTTVTGTSTNPFQYTGRENDGTGLYYYRERYYSPGLHRFISEDTLEFYAGSFNLFIYVFNNPLRFTDPYGLKPGDSYPTEDAAAIDAINDINSTSIKQDREYGGYIYRRSDGTYSYTPPVRGGQHSVNLGRPPKDGTVVGDYHTHGAESGPEWDDENFSDTDIKSNNRAGTKGYLGTPSGKIKKYTPPGGPVTDIAPPGKKKEGGRK